MSCYAAKATSHPEGAQEQMPLTLSRRAPRCCATFCGLYADANPALPNDIDLRASQ